MESSCKRMTRLGLFRPPFSTQPLLVRLVCHCPNSMVSRSRRRKRRKPWSQEFKLVCCSSSGETTSTWVRAFISPLLFVLDKQRPPRLGRAIVGQCHHPPLPKKNTPQAAQIKLSDLRDLESSDEAPRCVAQQGPQ